MQRQGPNCAREIEQLPGSHRQRRFCSDRYRITASRARRRSEQAPGTTRPMLLRKHGSS
jgi:hypothetical protein